MEEHILFSKLQQGDAGAFEWLYRKYHPKVYAFCKGILHDKDKAKDLAQECFVALWEYRARINAPEAVTSYLFHTMKNLCLKQLRRDALHDNFSHLETMALSELELSYYTPERNILEDIYFEELHARYMEALDKLPKQCQTIFKMNRNEGLRSDEIAGILHLSVRTVENQLYRGLKQIKKGLVDYLPLLLFVGNVLK